MFKNHVLISSSKTMHVGLVVQNTLLGHFSAPYSSGVIAFVITFKMATWWPF
jgi:hypothetical protein